MFQGLAIVSILFSALCAEKGGRDGRAGKHIANANDGPGGKSGLRRTRWWVTPTGRKTRESATESKPPKPVRFYFFYVTLRTQSF